jgi:hypothetical protein
MIQIRRGLQSPTGDPPKGNGDASNNAASDSVSTVAAVGTPKGNGDRRHRAELMRTRIGASQGNERRKATETECYEVGPGDYRLRVASMLRLHGLVTLTKGLIRRELG